MNDDQNFKLWLEKYFFKPSAELAERFAQYNGAESAARLDVLPDQLPENLPLYDGVIPYEIKRLDLLNRILYCIIYFPWIARRWFYSKFMVSPTNVEGARTSIQERFYGLACVVSRMTITRCRPGIDGSISLTMIENGEFDAGWQTKLREYFNFEDDQVARDLLKTLASEIVAWLASLDGKYAGFHPMNCMKAFTLGPDGNSVDLLIKDEGDVFSKEQLASVVWPK